MVKINKRTFALSICWGVMLALTDFVEAKNTYPLLIPNGNKVRVDGKIVPSLGHNSLTSTSTTEGFNKFGQEFGPNPSATIWQDFLCEKDSDGDGKTNGEELCDPGCTWNGGADPTCAPGVELSHPGLTGEENNYKTLVIVHIVCMVIAWIIIAPIAILLVIAFKREGAWWLRYHRGAMAVVGLLTTLGFLVMVANIGIEQISKNIHTKVGITVVLFTIVQVISGTFRVHAPPQGVTKPLYRLLWEGQHQWLGRLTLLLALIAIDTGIQIYWRVEILGYIIYPIFSAVAIICFAYVFLIRDKDKVGKMLPKQDTTTYTL